MKIDLVRSHPASYLPEAFAYVDYLQKHGWDAQIVDVEGRRSNADMQLWFMGVQPPILRSKKSIATVHEYHSLSMPPFAKLKNWIKRWASVVPQGRIFLNEEVQSDFGFTDGVPSICRDMGVDQALYDCGNRSPEYDLIYCGSVLGRSGLVPCIERLVRLGLTLLWVGDCPVSIRSHFSCRSVEFTGRLQRHELPSVFAKARVGLNFQPNSYPHNIQTSTKALEYWAAGMGVLTNRYAWARRFSESRGIKALCLEDLQSAAQLREFKFSPADVRDLEWNTLLSSARLETFLLNAYRNQSKGVAT